MDTNASLISADGPQRIVLHRGHSCAPNALRPRRRTAQGSVGCRLDCRPVSRQSVRQHPSIGGVRDVASVKQAGPRAAGLRSQLNGYDISRMASLHAFVMHPTGQSNDGRLLISRISIPLVPVASPCWNVICDWGTRAVTPGGVPDWYHRLVPLSRPDQRAGQLECPYHGWSFDGEGHCRSIPRADGVQTRGRRSRCASLPTAVGQGLLFVWMGAADAASSSALPSSRRWRTP